jgi:EAL domain-containing protein (putative c-di-GMP-specific phosphodiesterase class I)
VLEITESTLLGEDEHMPEAIAELRASGFRVAVDDFGTGYSSLTFLTRVLVDEVKIDRVFVRDMAESAEAAAIVRTTIDLARQLGLRVVAEGVETAEQRATLAELGCTAAQGFHFYPPLPPERVVEVLRSLGVAPPLALRVEA